MHDDVHNLLATIRQARQDARIDFRELADIAAKLIYAGIGAGRDLTGDEAEYQAFRAEVSAAYDHDIEPLDLPHVPAVLESYVDNALKTLLLLALDAARKAIA